jgi:hypothetical protein
LTAFSSKKITNGDEEDDDGDETTSKNSILAEIGIVLPGLTTTDLDSLGDISSLRLTTDQGREHFLTTKIDVHQCIQMTQEGTEFKMLPIVVCYVDPTPTSYKTALGDDSADRSLHAMTFIGAMIERRSTRTITQYIVLGVEEFATQRYEPDSHDAHKAIAMAIMTQIRVLDMVYNGYFSSYVVVMEINSLDLDNVWYKCGQMLNTSAYADLVKLISPCIVARRKRQNNGGDETRRRKLVKLINGLSMDGVLDKHIADRTTDADVLHARSILRYTLSDYDLTEENLKKQLDEKDKYKIGTRMGKDKVQRVLDFFGNCFVRRNGYTSCITAAKYLFSFTIKRKDIAAHIIKALERLVIKTRVTPSGKKNYTISGKTTTGAHVHTPDDLAITVIFSVSLYTKYAFFDNAETNDE